MMSLTILVRPKINVVLKEVRKVIKCFKKSPVKNAILQKHIKEKYGKEFTLLLDCRARWNSTERILDRFIQVFEIALMDLNAPELIIHECFIFWQFYFAAFSNSELRWEDKKQ